MPNSKGQETVSVNWLALKQTLPTSNYSKKRKRDNTDWSARGETTVMSPSIAPAVSLTPKNPSADPGRYIALDCEFVGVGIAGSESVLARVSIVNFHGNILLDTFVKPKERVTDYRTWVSGVTEDDLAGKGSGPCDSFEVVQRQVADLLEGRILIGHALQNDLKCLLLSHPRADTRDTQTYTPLQELAKTKRPGLRKLAKLVLDLDIQTDLGQGHSSVEDAQATMAIFRVYKEEWEKELRRGAHRSQTVSHRSISQQAAKSAATPAREQFRQAQTLGLSAALRHHGSDYEQQQQLLLKGSSSRESRKPGAAKLIQRGEWWKEL